MTELRTGATRASLALPSCPRMPSHWQGLRQRFDTLALRPPAGSADDAALARCGPASRAALLAWCGQGAGPGGTPFWQPGAPPRVGQRLAIGALHLARNADTRPVAANAGAQRGLESTATRRSLGAIAPSAWVDHVARQLDGSLGLAARHGRVAGLACRLVVKLDDAMWWRQRQIDDPWDAGWALDTPAALHQLQTAFWPRRATLVLADAASRVPLQVGLAALCQRQAGLRHPVRWLWVGGDDDLRALPAWPGLPVSHFAAA